MKSNDKKKNTKKKISRNKKSKQGDINGIIFIAIGILLSVAIYTDFAGMLSTGFQKFAHILFGIGAYILPVYILFLGYQYIKNKGNIILEKKFFGITVYVVVLLLFCSTIHLQMWFKEGGSSVNSTFFTSISDLVKADSIFNGGIVGNLIAYPMYKLIGALGSYILYIAFGIIGTVLTFDITVYDLGINIKNKSKKINKNLKPKLKVEPDKDTIKIKDPEKIKKDNDEMLVGVNNKIKVLDFMKNSKIHQEEAFLESEKEKPKIKINTPMVAKENMKKEIKKEELDDLTKEDVSSEIQNSLQSDREKIKYIHPSIDILNINKSTQLNDDDKQELIESADKLGDTLSSFGVDATVTEVSKGPSVTRFELQPKPGVKVSKIVNLADDIALGLAASGVRIEAPIPGKAAVGIEVPNKNQTPVFLREVLDSNEFKESNNKLAFALGKDIGGKCVVGDLSKMPHTLIAGATGSGKSVCINTLIVSLLYKYSPDEVKLLMVDPKVVELSVYNGIPHLLIPVVTDPKKAAGALNWAVNEMTRRYKLFADSGARNIDSYNSLLDKGLIEEKLPYIVIIVDELADLMMVCPGDVEDYIGRLAQMARAAGMHLVIATQRPSVDVITGVIKANIPSRISFAVSSQIDSRTILDSGGAEKLLGRGDMLYYPSGSSKPLRVQGCFISEEEVEEVVNFVKGDGEGNDYEADILEHIENESSGSKVESSENVDELLEEAISIVIDYKQASTSFLQRRLRIGFNRASRIMDELEFRGIISPKDGSRAREVLVTKEELIALDNEIND
ncbi:MAG: DNA translocase FtsK 4TM domain-containing protein [Clostridium chrysemydis]|uniref:FtsK/SpoIIIE family DNA translocase n=1 Tax=Clostridium chrysemydis TaxID=2665504 RepID=UPI003F2C13ED